MKVFVVDCRGRGTGIMVLNSLLCMLDREIHILHAGSFFDHDANFTEVKSKHSEWRLIEAREVGIEAFIALYAQIDAYRVSRQHFSESRNYLIANLKIWFEDLGVLHKNL